MQKNKKRGSRLAALRPRSFAFLFTFETCLGVVSLGRGALQYVRLFPLDGLHPPRQVQARSQSKAWRHGKEAEILVDCGILVIQHASLVVRRRRRANSHVQVLRNAVQ